MSLQSIAKVKMNMQVLIKPKIAESSEPARPEETAETATPQPSSSTSPWTGRQSKGPYQQAERKDNSPSGTEKATNVPQVQNQDQPPEEDGIVTKDMRFTDEEDSSLGAKPTPAEPPKMENPPVTVEDNKTVPTDGQNRGISAKAEGKGSKKPLRSPEHPSDSSEEQPIRFKQDHDEDDLLRGEVLEVLHVDVPCPNKPKLRKCCDCCSRHRRSSTPEKKKKKRKVQSKTRDPEDSTIGDRRIATVDSSVPTPSMDRVAQKSIREASLWPQELRCPACNDSFNVFIHPVDDEDERDDTIMTAVVDEEWQRERAEQVKRRRRRMTFG